MPKIGRMCEETISNTQNCRKTYKQTEFNRETKTIRNVNVVKHKTK